MAELAQAEVYATAGRHNKTLQLWKTLLNWVGFLFQILRGTPSWAQVLSYVGLRHAPFLWSASSSASPAFRPLPAEVPTDTLPLEAAPPPAPLRRTESGEASQKLTVVLDLDETLVCAYETSSLPVVVRNQAVEAGLNCFELECISVDKECEGRQKVNHVTVFERPGLPEFLQQISEFADLVLFTAGLEGYARPLVDRIDLENRFSLRLYRPATVSTVERRAVGLCTDELVLPPFPISKPPRKEKGNDQIELIATAFFQKRWRIWMLPTLLSVLSFFLSGDKHTCGSGEETKTVKE